MPRARGSRVPLALLAAYLVVWSLLAIRPSFPADWLLENVLVFVAIPVLAWSHRRVPLSNLAYGGLFVLFVLHAVGSHYTYSLVPYEQWFEAATGVPFRDWSGWQRNHYDRLVHFAYGLCVLPAAVDLFDARAPTRGLWRFLLPVLFIASHSEIYEIIEWVSAVLFGGDLGQAFLGTQGDVWDAQKDSAMALLGATISQTLLTLSRRRRASRPPA